MYSKRLRSPPRRRCCTSRPEYFVFLQPLLLQRILECFQPLHRLRYDRFGKVFQCFVIPAVVGRLDPFAKVCFPFQYPAKIFLGAEQDGVLPCPGFYLFQLPGSLRVKVLHIRGNQRIKGAQQGIVVEQKLAGISVDRRILGEPGWDDPTGETPGTGFL